MNYKLKCTHCGYERPITSEWLEDLRMKFSSSTSGLVVENIKTYLPRFKCSICSSKAASIIRSKSLSQRFPVNQSEQKKTKYIKWGTVLPPVDNQVGQEKIEPIKWSKKTCPACNGDGLGGHCYKCEGTGWVEALF
jgi:DNA-directed RNA polymerase subunit M/transcription elongation factor TFIIS